MGSDLALAIALVSLWVCAAMACAKCAGQSEENLFKKAKGRLYYFYVNRVLTLFQSTVSLVAYLSTLRICFSKMSTVLFEN